MASWASVLAQTVEIVHDFARTVYDPGAGVIQARDGFLYGTSNRGGVFDVGTIYRMDGAGSVTVLHSFQCSVATNGCAPVSGLIQLSDGFLYGTTTSGGLFI